MGRELYGGAVTLAFPARFDDISEHRQVPDHQEVSSFICRKIAFQSPRNFISFFILQVFADPTLDQSLVVEVVVSCREQFPREHDSNTKLR